MADRNTKINGNQIKDATVTADELAASVAGSGLAGGAGSALSVGVDDATTEISSDQVIVKDAGITAAKLAAAVAGDGLAGGAGSALSVNVDDSTIEINADSLRVKADGIGANEINEGDSYTFTSQFRVSTAPTVGTDVANKTYVDSVASGLDVKDSVRLITTSNITLSGEQTIDGVLTSSDRVLVNGQSTGSENGIYDTGAGAWTRSSDLPAAASAASVFTFVEEGTLNADNGFVCTNDVGNDTVGTHDLVFVQFSGAGQVIAGDGLSKDGNTLDVNVTGACEIDTDAVDVKDLGIDTARLAASAVTEAKIATSVAGDGLAGGAGSALSVNVDDSSIEINTDTLRVKALGITNAMLAGSISDAKLVEDYIKTSEVDDSSIEFGASLNVKALGITNSMIANDTIQEPKLNATNAPSDGEVLSYNAAGTNFTWISGTADAVVEGDFQKGTFTAVAGTETVMASFSGSAAVLANPTQVYLNGLIQEEGAGNDYTIVLATGVVTFLTALDIGDIVHMHGVLDN